jgi:hypothetical protein
MDGNVRDVTLFLAERSRVHEAFIREEARTKRLALIVGAVLFASGCLVIVYAPSGRETVSGIIGAAMLVVAAGTTGYKRVWGRSAVVSVGADQDSTSSDSRRESALRT